MIDILQGVVSHMVEFSLSTLAIVVCNNFESASNTSIDSSLKRKSRHTADW